jgi:FtsP/CotA-like multicopper oxidase with cupredoxin domain/plastocyanin
VSFATVLSLVAALTALVIIPAQASQAPPDQRVSIEHLSFVPPDLTVPVNTTVVWTNNEGDKTQHSVTGGPLGSPDLSPGMTYSHTFTGPGSFTYHCKFHSYMEGKVTVTAPVTTTTTAAPTTSTTTPSTSTSTTAPSTTSTTSPTNGDDGSQYLGAPLGDGTFLAKYDLVNGVKVFHLVMSQVDWETTKGQVLKGFAFNGVIPGPVIRVNEGDRLRFIVENKLPAGEMTGVHWHGMVLPNDQDGVPGLTQDPIEPGQTYTYEWTAITTGTHWYHAHMGGAQIGKGLFGPLQIVPKGGNDIPADHDYSLMFSDTNLGFTLNGKKFPDTTQLHSKVGERVHIRLYDPGDDEHAIHLHGTQFQVVAQDGHLLPEPYYADTLSISPGQTFDIVAVMTMPGKWALHCHKFIHSENMSGMNGMTTVLNVT